MSDVWVHDMLLYGTFADLALDRPHERRSEWRLFNVACSAAASLAAYQATATNLGSRAPGGVSSIRGG